MNDNDTYYAVFTEWLYPTESGRDFVGDFDTMEEAIEACKSECDKELENYESVCGDALWPSQYTNDGASGRPEGYVITAKNGLDEWWFAAKIVPVKFSM